MQMLADGLKKYHPEADIKTNNRNLQNVRLFSEELHFSPFTAYLMPMEHERIVCSNGNDILTLHTDDMNGVLNDILDLFEYYNAFEDRIAKMTAKGCGEEELLKELSDMTGYLFVLADATFYIRASYGPSQILGVHHDLAKFIEERMLPVEALKQINASADIRRPDIPSYLLTVPGIGSALVTNLFCRNHHMGWLITCKEDFAFTKGEENLADQIGRLVSEWLETDQSQEERGQKAGIFLDYLDGKTAERPLERLEPFGWYPQDEKQIYVIMQNEKALLPLQVLANQIDKYGNGLFSFLYRDDLVVVIDHALLNGELFSAFLSEQLENVGYAAGESPVFLSMDELRVNYEAAKLAADYARKSDSLMPILRFQESIIPYAVSLLKEHTAADLSHPAMALLIRYDEEHNTAMLQTLKVFLEENCSHSAAAKRLFIHRSTLIYRIEKITEMTGIDFSNADERFHLLLSFYLCR